MLQSLSQNHWGLAPLPQTIVNVYRKFFSSTDCLYDTHIVQCKMRSLLSKSLLGRMVGMALRINLRPGLKGDEGNLVISTLPLPQLQADAEPSQGLLCSLISLFKAFQEGKS